MIFFSNILFHQNKNEIVFVLCDFGWATVINNAFEISDAIHFVGNPFYGAPELFDDDYKVYSNKIDIWYILKP